VQAAAEAIAKSRRPLIVIDHIDLAGAAACVELAKASNATLAHAHPDVTAQLQQQGIVTTTPGEAALRGDLVVCIGPFDTTADTDEGFRRLIGSDRKPPVIHLAPSTGTSPPAAEISTHPQHELDELLTTLTAISKGAAVEDGAPLASKSNELLARLKNAAYGIIAIQPQSIPASTMFAAMELVDALSKTTRFSFLFVGTQPGQQELQRMSLSLTGLPPPVAFSQRRRTPLHVPLPADVSARIAQDGHDLLVRVSSDTGARPDWVMQASVPKLLIDAGEPPQAASDGSIHHVRIGRPGIDHPAILAPQELTGFASCAPEQTPPATAPPSAADVLADLAARIARQATAA